MGADWQKMSGSQLGLCLIHCWLSFPSDLFCKRKVTHHQ